MVAFDNAASQNRPLATITEAGKMPTPQNQTISCGIGDAGKMPTPQNQTISCGIGVPPVLEHSESDFCNKSNLGASFFPVLDLYSRARQFWQEILPHHPNQTLLIVSHSGTLRALIATALGLTPERFHALEQSNCGISILNFPDGDQAPAQLEALNLTTHLGETLPQTNAGRQGLRLLLVPSGNEAQMRQVGQLLKKESIDFSISGTDDDAEAIATTILPYHPTTVQLQVTRDDFPQVWQQAITTRSYLSSNSSQLITGLLVGSNYIIQRLIRQVLGMNFAEIGKLQLGQGAVSVIHYPLAERSPILQGMNIFR
ncbi:MAG TPA: hypothetical protein DDW76_04960 [Cyanobacteria bacterium UBA11369]|nr:hypothetical protein [Cyanobacteria bacterium UBA11371]HBE36855.1 hypothetical protein [Cyanobacteria bacterium UBA11368]HBE48156.1 hypothetical protein [Cyanobacteria bacterium UBA11369]